MVFGIDFDGSVVTHEYPRVGEDIGAVPVLKALVENGHKIICYTMRGPGTKEEQDAKDWFKQNDIPLFGFNENPEQASWSDSRKVYAHVYIDDAALGCPLCYSRKPGIRPFIDWYGVAVWLEDRGVIDESQAEACYKHIISIQKNLYVR